MKLPKSTYYRYIDGRNPKNDRYEDVRPLMRKIFARTPNGMGYRQVRMALKHEKGLAISGKTVLKLMRQEGLFFKYRRKKYDSYKGEQGRIANNILGRNFNATHPLEKLVTDVTEFAVAGAKAYLSPVMDLYNNEILSWSVSTHPNMLQINEMMDKLESKLDGTTCIMHSDQGWQYQQLSYQLRLKRLGITQSMSRKATCLDNACMEGFFGHLKDEFYRGRKFESFEQFKIELDEYINYWNKNRYQEVLNEMTPVEYRGHMRAA